MKKKIATCCGSLDLASVCIRGARVGDVTDRYCLLAAETRIFQTQPMKPKQSKIPVPRVKKPEPSRDSGDWVIWAAWADRITFEEIRKVTGLSERQVIERMRRELKPSSFRRWRRRATTQSIKHQKLFRHRREQTLDY